MNDLYGTNSTQGKNYDPGFLTEEERQAAIEAHKNAVAARKELSPQERARRFAGELPVDLGELVHR